MTPQFTPDQIEQMRHLLSVHDANAAGKGVREFDLNNPPQTQYRHQEYPCAMYHHATGRTRAAKNAEEQAAAEASGWTREAMPPAPEPESPLSAADEAAAAEIDSKLEKKGKRS